MTLSDAILLYKMNYPGTKIRGKVLEDSISEDDEASCFEALADLLLPNGIIEGLGVAIDGSNNLIIQPGRWIIDRAYYSTLDITTIPLDAQDPTLSRYDLFYANTMGVIGMISGDLSADPIEPSLPDETIKVCSALITPTSITIITPPPTDYVDTFSDQSINGVKTFIKSPQVPNAVNAQDAVAFNQLSGYFKTALFNNGIGPTTGSNYGIGGSPLVMDTTLNLASHTFYFTQGLKFSGDFSAYFDANNRAIIDAGYFRNNQWYRPWISGQNYVNNNLVSNYKTQFYVNTTITNSTVAPYSALRPAQFSGAAADSSNIANYLAWVTDSTNFTPAGDGLLYLEITFNTANNTTFPLFSLTATPFGEDWVGFSVGVDNNTVNGGYFAEYKFCTSQIITNGVWYELLPLMKSHDFISRSTRTYEFHVDIAKNPSGGYEVRGRHKLLSGSSSYQDYSIEITRSKTRQFFAGATITPSLYWNILNGGTDPNTQLTNWKGTDSGTPAFVRGATVGIGPQISYAFLTSGLDNYTSDLSGSFTALTKITKGYGDSTYLTSASLTGYLLKSGGTMTGILNIAADPVLDDQAANKHYVDAAILAKATYFTAGTFKPAGPTFTDDPGTINNPWEYGDIVADTITTNAGTNTFNNTAGTNVVNFKNAGTTVGAINIGGAFYGAGISALTGPNDGRIVMDPTGTVISRNQADAVPALKTAQLNLSSTGDIAQFYNQYRSVFNIGIDGSIIQHGLSKAVATVAVGYNFISGLKPTANGDVLVGMSFNPAFGISTIASLTGLVGGSGYPNGTFLSNVSGGTGQGAVVQVTVSGGIITGASLIDGGINYTVGNTLTIVITVAGVSVGSGGTINVASNTTYTGVTKISAQFNNAPIVLNTIATPAVFVNGMLWQDNTHIYARINGASYQLDQQGGGGTISTDNGISGDGSGGSPVILGGTITGTTIINNVSHDLFLGDYSYSNSYIDIDNTSTSTGGVVSISGGGGSGTKFGRISFDDSGVNVSANNSAHPGGGTGFILRSLNDGTASGIIVQDQNNIGMEGSGLFPVFSTIQYAQYGITDARVSGVALTSTTSGTIPWTKMTTTQRTAIATPGEGSAVYDLTLHKLFIYDGTAWQGAW